MLPPDEDRPEEPAAALEALAALAEGEGATVERLASAEGRPLLELAQFPPDWSPTAQASAVRNLLTNVISSLENVSRREIGLARFALSAEYSYPNPTRRVEALLEAGILDPHEHSPGEKQLPGIGRALDQMLIDRLTQINGTDWHQYASRDTIPHEPPQRYPIRFVRYHMLFTLSGKVGIECTTYRWLRALTNGVDSYKAVLWYYSDPRAQIEILPLANCGVGEIRSLERGGYEATLELPHSLRKGQTCFFASRVIFHSDHDSAPIVSHEVRCEAVDQLEIGVQFDPHSTPSAIWHYTGSRQVGMTRPREGSSDFLVASPLGFVSHQFNRCRNGRRYGIQWDWRSTRNSPGTPERIGE